MKTIRENVSYLQGLVEGVNLNATTNEGRVIKGIIDTIESWRKLLNGLKEGSRIWKFILTALMKS